MAGARLGTGAARLAPAHAARARALTNCTRGRRARSNSSRAIFDRRSTSRPSSCRTRPGACPIRPARRGTCEGRERGAHRARESAVDARGLSGARDARAVVVREAEDVEQARQAPRDEPQERAEAPREERDWEERELDAKLPERTRVRGRGATRQPPVGSARRPRGASTRRSDRGRGRSRRRRGGGGQARRRWPLSRLVARIDAVAVLDRSRRRALERHAPNDCANAREARVRESPPQRRVARGEGVPRVTNLGEAGLGGPVRWAVRPGSSSHSPS